MLDWEPDFCFGSATSEMRRTTMMGVFLDTVDEEVIWGAFVVVVSMYFM